MFSLSEMQAIAKSQNVIFYKPGCPYCAATEELFRELKELGAIDSYEVYYVGRDFDNQTLKNLCTGFGWSDQTVSGFPTKPQIFMNTEDGTEYFAGNAAFNQSSWNLGQAKATIGKLLMAGGPVELELRKDGRVTGIFVSLRCDIVA